MKIDKMKLGKQSINLIASVILVIGYFLPLLSAISWSRESVSLSKLVGDSLQGWLLILVPLALCGVGLLDVQDKKIHLGWVIFSSMATMLMFSIGGMAQGVFFGTVRPTVIFYLHLLLYLTLLVYNGGRLLDYFSKLQEKVAEKTIHHAEMLGKKAMEMKENQSKKKETAVEVEKTEVVVENKESLEAEETVEVNSAQSEE